jgi:hypothetical protein
VRRKYRRKVCKSNHKFEIVQGQELLVRVPLPMAEMWAEMQARVEELNGQAGLPCPAGRPGKRSHPPNKSKVVPKFAKSHPSHELSGFLSTKTFGCALARKKAIVRLDSRLDGGVT